MTVANTSVPFWPEDKIAAYNAELPLLTRVGKNYLDQSWPANGPTQDEVFRQLRKVERVWVSVYRPKDKDGIFLTFLAGNYKVTANVGMSNGNPRLWLGRISYFNHQDQARMLQNGALAAVKGLLLITGREFGEGLEIRESKFATGTYVTQLLEIIASPWNVHGEQVTFDEELDELDYQELELIDALRSFVNAEYELEQRAALQEPPFNAFEIQSVSQKTTYRLHYQMQFDDADYERLVALKPSLLVQLSDLGAPTDVLVEITDLAPVENQPIIRVSIEKQLEHARLPERGMFGLAAMPTLKNVREAVIDALAEKESKNPWLLSVAAGTYEAAPLNPVNVPLPESKFPPTASQVKAINSGAGTDDYTLVLGPPGTGKTTVILQWVKYFAAQGMRVLVTSQNNKAVDNVLERLAEEQEFECLRIGNENKISSSLEDITLDNKAVKLQKELFAGADAIMKRLANLQQSLEHLQSQKDVMMEKVGERDRARTIYAELSAEKENLQCKLPQYESIACRYEARADEIRTAIRYKNRPKWFVLQFIADWLHERQLNALEEQLSQTKASLVSALRTIEQKKLAIEHNERKLQFIAEELAKVESDIGQWQLEFDVIVPQFNFIKPDVELEITSIQGIESTLEKVKVVQQELFQWFEKLRNERQQALYKILMEKVNVIGATCIGINTKSLFRELDFDVVIVDESGQIQLHNILVPLSRAKKAILVGDHKQLPPVVSDEVLEEIEAQGFEDYQPLYQLSWFEHLWNAAPDDHKIMLDTQFRCPAIISDFVSEAFYGGRYFAGVGMDKKQPLFAFCPQPMVWLDICKMPKKRESSVIQDGRTVVQDNPCETALVLSVLEQAIIEKPELAINREIGVIVPYANHVKAIQKAIKRAQKQGKLKELSMPLNELVASVDSFQGQERDLIIFTFTRSNNRGNVGFLADWRRLNVAQTRAKKQLVMIGDSETLTKGAERDDVRDKEFKQAMCLLKSTLSDSGALLNASTIFGAKTTARPAKPEIIANHAEAAVHG